MEVYPARQPEEFRVYGIPARTENVEQSYDCRKGEDESASWYLPSHPILYS
jgi:hypothetical protein